MEENKRLITLFAGLVLIVGIILLISFWPEKDATFACDVKADDNYEKLGKVNYKQYQCLYKIENKNALVVAENLSDDEKSNLNEVAKKIGHALYYLDIKNISKDDIKTIKKELKYNDDSFKKSVIITIKKGKIGEYKEDILGNSDKLYNFLKEAKLAKYACDVTSTEDYKNLGGITYEQYKCLLDSEEPFALVLEQTTCGYCQSFNPIIDEYAGENNLPIYTIQIDTLSDIDKSALTSSLKYFDNNDSWGTPLTLGIKNKEVIADVSGYTEDTGELDSLFKKLGLK